MLPSQSEFFPPPPALRSDGSADPTLLWLLGSVSPPAQAELSQTGCIAVRAASTCADRPNPLPSSHAHAQCAARARDSPAVAALFSKTPVAAPTPAAPVRSDSVSESL